MRTNQGRVFRMTKARQTLSNSHVLHKIAKHNKRTTYSPNELHVMRERLFDLEVCLIHENSGGKIKHTYVDLSKIFKSDFDPNILPQMPKIATRQTIPPHNPVANSRIYKPLSDGDDSSVRSDGSYSELDQLWLQQLGGF